MRALSLDSATPVFAKRSRAIIWRFTTFPGVFIVHVENVTYSRSTAERYNCDLDFRVSDLERLYCSYRL